MGHYDWARVFKLQHNLRTTKHVANHDIHSGGFDPIGLITCTHSYKHIVCKYKLLFGWGVPPGHIGT